MLIRPKILLQALTGALIFGWLFTTTFSNAQANDKYSQDEILNKASDFFGGASAGIAKGIEKIFSDLGKPNGIIEGEEFGGAFLLAYVMGRAYSNEKNQKTILFIGKVHP